MFLVITLGRCSRRTQWGSSLDWTTTYTTFTVAVLLLVHDHMFLQNVLQPRDLIMWLGFLNSPAIYISTPLYTLRFWTKCLNAWETFFLLGAPITHVVGCSGAQTTTIMYLRIVCLRINLRLNNIFCYCLNFTFLSILIIKSSTHKLVSGHLW